MTSLLMGDKPDVPSSYVAGTEQPMPRFIPTCPDDNMRLNS